MQNLWQETLKRLEKEVSSQNFTTWIKPVQFISVENNDVVLEVPNRFVKEIGVCRIG